MHAKLIPITGNQSFRLSQRVTVVGRRDKACGIYLDDLRISRVHCVIRQTDDGELELRDLGSTNGTRINGHKVTEGLLLHGDEIAFARDRFRLSIDGHADQKVESEVDQQRKVETIEMSDVAEPRDSNVVMLNKLVECGLDLSSNDSSSDSAGDASGEGTRKRVVLELPPRSSEDEDERTVLEMARREPQTQIRHEDTIIANTEVTEELSPPGMVAPKPSIHPCPRCLQTQLVESPGRWWQFPLRLVFLRPFECPQCKTEYLRLNV